MNLCKDILDQFSGDALGKLSSLLDTDSDTASYAVKAAAPALLSGLAGLASREDGVKKLTGALSQLGSSGVGDLASMLSGDANGLAQKGTSLLSMLFGDNQLSGIVNAVSKYAGLASNSVRGLLAFLAPMALGKIASIWKSKGSTPQALTNLFAEQRDHIADCAPSGFSLADIPGWTATKDAARSAATAGRRAATYAEPAAPSVARWAVPLALVQPLAGFLLWNFMRGGARREAVAERSPQVAREVTTMKPVTPDASPLINADKVPMLLNDLYASAAKVMSGIKDAASAEAARPQLEEISDKIDLLQRAIDQMPAAGKTAAKELADKGFATFNKQAEATLETPGLGAEIKSLIQRVIQKLAELFGPATP